MDIDQRFQERRSDNGMKLNSFVVGPLETFSVARILKEATRNRIQGKLNALKFWQGSVFPEVGQGE